MTSNVFIKNLALFTDASLSPKLRRGIGASLLVPAAYLEMSPADIDCAAIIGRTGAVGQLKTQQFEETSSTKLEVQTVLWALDDYQRHCRPSAAGRLSLYCDSGCISHLLQRRAKLESGRFLCRKTNRELKNSGLYRQFYKLYDNIGFEVIKVTGHSPSSSHDAAHRIFSFVDQQARKALKQWIKG